MKKIIYIFLAFVPTLTLAQTPAETVGALSGVLEKIADLFDKVIPIIIGIGVLYFLWGLVQFIRANGKGDEKNKEAGKSHMLWGIIALVVMISFWGLINIVQNATGLGASENTTFTTPKVPRPSSTQNNTQNNQP